MVKNFIWDFDGTLFDTYPVLARFFSKVLSNYGIQESVDHIQNQMKISMSHMYQYYSDKYHLSEQVFVDYENLSSQKEREYAKPFPYTIEVCKAVVDHSGQNFLFTHRGPSALCYLKNSGIDPYFTECITSEYGFRRKPDPEAIQYLIQKYDLDTSQTIIVGDRDIDIQSGKTAGILTCYCNGDLSKKSSYADYSIHSLREIALLL